MPIKDLTTDLPQELNLWAARVFKRIKKRFLDFQISMSVNEKGGYTGDLYRRMHWEVHSAAGGNKAFIEFFYMKYGDFVQWGVGAKRNDPLYPHGQKLWDVPALKGKEVKPIQATSGRNYYAKPYLRREVRYHTQWLLKRLAEQYAYTGNLYIVRGLSEGMGDPSIMNKWIEDNKDLLTKGFLDMMGIK